eukprot:6181536-Pleurochrysis_carterae.AAC.1
MNSKVAGCSAVPHDVVQCSRICGCAAGSFGVQQQIQRLPTNAEQCISMMSGAARRQGLQPRPCAGCLVKCMKRRSTACTASGKARCSSRRIRRA